MLEVRFGFKLGEKKEITPFCRPSCQAREEKRKFLPTAHSSAAAPPLSTQSHVSCCAAHACRGERKWRPKVYPARQVVHSFSRCLSLLMTAAIVRASRFVFSQECLVELDHRGARPDAPILFQKFIDLLRRPLSGTLLH